ncbi:MAG: hypothetical protein M0Z27_00530, partial [Thermaerobacter sp.]|nr:hypothetical protein [Thermaerobacter sp.]
MKTPSPDEELQRQFWAAAQQWRHFSTCFEEASGEGVDAAVLNLDAAELALRAALLNARQAAASSRTH